MPIGLNPAVTRRIHVAEVAGVLKELTRSATTRRMVAGPFGMRVEGDVGFIGLPSGCTIRQCRWRGDPPPAAPQALDNRGEGDGWDGEVVRRVSRPAEHLAELREGCRVLVVARSRS